MSANKAESGITSRANMLDTDLSMSCALEMLSGGRTVQQSGVGQRMHKHVCLRFEASDLRRAVEA